MQAAQNSYGKGIDQDSSYEKRDPNSYYDALNVRIVTEDGLSTGSVENEKGNQISFKLPGTQRCKRYNSDGNGNLENGFGGPISDYEYFEIRGPTSFQRQIDISSASTLQEVYDIVINDSGIQQDINDGGYEIYLNNRGREILIFGVDALAYAGMRKFNGDLSLAEEPIPEQSDLKILGWGTVRDRLVVFTTNSTSEVPEEEILHPSTGKGRGTAGQIWVLEYDEDFDRVIDLDSNGYLTKKDHLLFNGVLNFSLFHEIADEVIGRYETQDIQRVYWTDDHNSLRTANIEQEDLFRFALSPDSIFSIRPSADFSQPQITDIGSGNIPVGSVVQIGYRLKSDAGTVTAYSPLSKPIKLVNEDPKSSSYNGYNSDPKDTGNSRSLTFNIPSLDTRFDVMELVAIIDDGSQFQLPSITRFSEERIGGDGQNLERTFTNNEDQVDITYEEFNAVNKPFDICKSLTSKDNRLLAANTRSEDPARNVFDARAYRFNGSQVADLYDRSLSVQYSIDGTASSIDFSQVDDEADAINPYNNEDKSSNWENNYQYKYQADGVTLGGEGPNISYKFTARQYPTDEQGTGSRQKAVGKYSGSSTIDLGHKDALGDPVEHEIGKSFKDQKSPFLSSVLKGYKSGEVYRFGIVFYDLEGHPGAVQWIGDIKFPKIYEDTSISPLINYGASTYADGNSALENRTMGIEFTVDVSDIEDKISGFEIVRVERTPQDMTRPSSGFLTGLSDFTTNSGGFTKGEDWIGFPSHNRAPGAADTAGTIPTITSFGSANMKEKYIFHSPDAQFPGIFGQSPLKAQEFNNNDFLEVLGYMWFNDDGMNAAGDNGSYHRYSETPSSLFSVVKFQLARFKYKNDRVTRSLKKRTLVNTGKANSDPTSNAGNFFFYNYIWLNSAGGNEPDVLIGPNPFSNGNKIVTSNGDTDKNNDRAAGIHGATCVLESEDYITLTTGYYMGEDPDNTSGLSEGNIAWPYVDYCRVIPDQYGGAAYEQRSRNEYISTGHYQSVSGLNGSSFTIEVYGGDVYSTVYSEKVSTRNIKETAEDNTSHDFSLDKPDTQIIGEVESHYSSFDNEHVYLDAMITYPVETVVDTQMRRGEYANKEGRDDGGGNVYLEEYLLDDSIIMVNNNKDQFFAQDFLVNIINEQPHRIWISDQKFDGENEDSWSRFRSNNYNTVHGVHGPINRILNWRDKVYFFQTDAFGAQPVNERALSKDSQGNQIVLGDGSLIGDYAYVSLNTGTHHQYSAKGSPSGIYFFDSNNMKLYRFDTNSNTPLSDVKGLSAFLADRTDSVLMESDRIIESHHGGSTPDAVVRGGPSRIGVHAVFDNRFNRMIFTFLTGRYELAGFTINDEGVGVPEYEWKDRSFTLSFNERLQAFESFYSFLPSLYIDTWRRVLSVDPEDGSHSGKVYVHNEGSRGEFYGARKDSYVEHVITKEPQVTKIFDNFEFHSEVYNTPGNYLDNETITAVRCYNVYQDSTKKLLSSDDIKQRFRKWRLHVPRAQVDRNGITLNVSDTRMRSPWLHVTLYYDNDRGNRLVLRDLVTRYRRAMF